MGSQKDNNSDVGDAEDNIPSDFFDDFNKDDFMNGLSVIDSWDDDDNKRPRINTERLDSVNDLRELIGDGRAEDKKNKRGFVKFDNRFSWSKEDKSSSKPSERESRLDDYIKPGSRRDPNKTNEAIKKDKEVKVKEYLAKHLEASDDLRPPGTELDDYFVENNGTQKKKSPIVKEESKSSHRPRDYQRSSRMSPLRPRRSRSPRKHRSRSPFRPHRSPIRSSRRISPRRLSPRRHSPRKYTRQWSPHRHSPARRSPRRSNRSRSPRRMYPSRRSRTRSPASQHRDSFLYPGADTSVMYPAGNPYPPVGAGYPGDYSGGIPGYSYPQGPPYAGYGGPGYDYGMQPSAPVIPQPQPVPAPILDPVLPPGLAPPLSSVQAPIINTAPEMVPAPSQIVSPSSMKTAKPYDALAQLVAEGKLSQQDYLKLAPNKGISNSNMDTKTRVMVLNRCQQAISKLATLLLPNRLTMNSAVIGQEPKYLAPKFCSPLKRQATVEFQFTKNGGTSVQHNKQLVDSIISTIGLDKVVARPKKKVPKDMKDAAVQTIRPHCEVCEIRESTKHNEAGTSIDPEHFSSSTHTQVVEQELLNSKSLFNTSGGASTSAPISIAHLTPAQLVSQLAARAKTLKETEPMHSSNQFGRRNPPNSYDNYDNRGGQYNNYNYRY